MDQANRTLLEVLREDLHLTGAKEACGMVPVEPVRTVNGKPVNSCITLAVEAEGKEIETVEGLCTKRKTSSSPESLH